MDSLGSPEPGLAVLDSPRLPGPAREREARSPPAAAKPRAEAGAKQGPKVGVASAASIRDQADMSAMLIVENALLALPFYPFGFCSSFQVPVEHRLHVCHRPSRSTLR